MGERSGLPGRLVAGVAVAVLGAACLGACGDSSSPAADGAAPTGSTPSAGAAPSSAAGGTTTGGKATGGKATGGKSAAPKGSAGSAGSAGAAGSAGSTPGAPLVTQPAPVAPVGKQKPPANGPTQAKNAEPGDLAAVVTTARASTSQVAQLHDIAVSAGTPGAIPANLIPTTAATIAATLRQQAAVASMMGPKAATPQARLATALSSYGELADTVAAWDASSGKPLAGAFFTRLAAADRSWKAAMQDLGGVAHRDLLANTPALLLPR